MKAGQIVGALKGVREGLTVARADMRDVSAVVLALTVIPAAYKVLASQIAGHLETLAVDLRDDADAVELVAAKLRELAL